ncbi:MAG: hypothetical protein WA892_01235 [Ornithinimicrobium sp.]
MAPRPPFGYPWAVPLREGVLDGQGFHETGPPQRLPAGRSPVLASGSNASPEVVRDKLGSTLGDGPAHQVVFTPVLVPGLGVGHSAHVSRPGYVAAAPYRTQGPGTHRAPTYVLGWFTCAQLDRLDATEPQYRRVSLPDDMPVHTRSGGQVVSGVQLYVSRHGLIAERGTPVPLRSQTETFDWLRDHLTCLRGRTMQAYADADLREQVRVELVDRGWTSPSRLERPAQA